MMQILDSLKLLVSQNLHTLFTHFVDISQFSDQRCFSAR